jgi:plastocyanin
VIANGDHGDRNRKTEVTMRTLLSLSLLALLSAAAADGADHRPGIDPSRSRARESATVDVAIRTFQFAPDTLRARAGVRVVWTNDDEIEHTITSGTPDARDGHFHGVVAKRGATYSAALDRPGTYRYFCDRHRFMNGTVIITR